MDGKLSAEPGIGEFLETGLDDGVQALGPHGTSLVAEGAFEDAQDQGAPLVVEQGQRGRLGGVAQVGHTRREFALRQSVC